MIFEHMDRIVFAGDSVTDMGSKNPVGEGLFDNTGRSYVRIIENMLATWYPERYVRVTNSGISGNTSRDLLARWQRDVLDLSPQYVSICIGINDVWRQFDSPQLPEQHVSPELYEKTLGELVSSTRPQLLGGLVLMTPYFIEPDRQDAMRRRMDEYGDVCRRIAARENLPLVDTQAAFDRVLKYRHSSYITWDRVHPNIYGATVLARAFLEAVGFDYNHQ